MQLLIEVYRVNYAKAKEGKTAAREAHLLVCLVKLKSVKYATRVANSIGVDY